MDLLISLPYWQYKWIILTNLVNGRVHSKTYENQLSFHLAHEELRLRRAQKLELLGLREIQYRCIQCKMLSTTLGTSDLPLMIVAAKLLKSPALHNSSYIPLILFSLLLVVCGMVIVIITHSLSWCHLLRTWDLQAGSWLLSLLMIALILPLTSWDKHHYLSPIDEEPEDLKGRVTNLESLTW